jgi:hypothetical protein
MNDIPLRSLVEDWGGFEKLVAKLHETGTVQVEHNITLIGKSGASRQIDVLVKHREGLYEHLIIIECKYWKENVSRLHVDALVTAVHDLNASRGVIFSAKGFQEGAITASKHTGIELYKVRELTDIEWGLPGRVIDFFIQFIQRSIGNVQFHGTSVSGIPRTPIHLNIAISENYSGSKTPTIKRDGSSSRTLEELIISASGKALDEFTKKSFLFCDGADCTRYVSCPVNYEPPEPILVPWENIIITIPKITFDLGIKYEQSRIVHDRAKQLMFALAVENCVRDGITIASRKSDETHTVLATTSSNEPVNKEDVMKNGSILQMRMKGFFPFEEMANLQPVHLDEVLKPRSETKE